MGCAVSAILRPKLHGRRYTATDQVLGLELKRLEPTGREVAAERLTGYLKAEHLLVYTVRNQAASHARRIDSQPTGYRILDAFLESGVGPHRKASCSSTAGLCGPDDDWQHRNIETAKISMSNIPNAQLRADRPSNRTDTQPWRHSTNS